MPGGGSDVLLPDRPHGTTLLSLGLRPQEAYFQITDSLMNLNQTIDEIFTRISSQVDEKQNRLHELNQRIADADAKVEHVRKSFMNKATVVHSAAKYPGNVDIMNGKALFDGKRKPIQVSPFEIKENLKLQKLPIGDGVDPVAKGINLNFEKKHIDLADVEDLEWEGLGRLPDNMSSVGNLLLFNTKDNPYKLYLTLDNLAGVEGPEKSNPAENVTLSEGPESFINPEVYALSDLKDNDVGYQPKLLADELPAFDLPDNLPELLVADVTFQGSDFSSIAPSSNYPELPTNFEGDLSSDSSFSLNPDASATAPPPPPESAAAPPPPPPSSNAPPPPPPPSSNAPPPPPPPSAAPPPPPAAGAPPTPAPASEPAESGGRGGLLADIRKGHAGRLRAAKDRKPSAKAEAKKAESKSSSAAASPGNLFGDLITKLTLRRKAFDQPEVQKTSGGHDDEGIPSLEDEWDD